MSEKTKDTAGPGEVFVCPLCERTSKTRTLGKQKGWDESCALRAVLCYEKKNKEGEWVPVKPD